VPGLAAEAAHLRQEMVDRRLAARAWTREHGDDDPVIRDWIWPH
jgi:xylulose-5-phosphate/fructose-6-phosphate phosphoketolase